MSTVKDEAIKLRKNIDAVYEAGQKAEYDSFWDTYQQNGARQNYNSAFPYIGWTDETFKPKYNMIITNGSQMFQYTNITDLADKLNELGLVFDTSAMTSMLQGFQGAKILHIPELDLSKCTSFSYIFGSSPAVETIDKLILSETTEQSFLGTNAFINASKLKNIVFEGVITRSINLSWSPLTVDSMKSVISCLKNYAGTEKDGAYKVSFTGACWEALEASGAAPNGGTWKEYVATLGWTV